MNQELRDALTLKYQGDIAAAKANIKVYLNNPVGIGDHPSIVETLKKELSLLEHENGKLNNLVRFFERQPEQKTEAPVKEKK